MGEVVKTKYKKKEVGMHKEFREAWNHLDLSLDKHGLLCAPATVDVPPGGPIHTNFLPEVLLHGARPPSPPTSPPSMLVPEVPDGAAAQAAADDSNPAAAAASSDQAPEPIPPPPAPNANPLEMLGLAGPLGG